jgi:hypothetical protein
MGQSGIQAPHLEEEKIMKRCSFLIIVAIALAACAGAAPAPGTPPASPVETAAVSPVATPIAPPEPSGAAPTATSDRVAVFPNTIIVFQREGGFAGRSDKWTIYPTGRIVAGDGTEWQVPAEQVKPLFDLVESAEFWDLSEKYPATGACADCYTYTLTVYQEGKTKTVTFTDAADLPPVLRQTLASINKSIES